MVNMPITTTRSGCISRRSTAASSIYSKSQTASKQKDGTTSDKLKKNLISWNVKRPNMTYLIIWRVLALVSVIFTILSMICVCLAISKERWEVNINALTIIHQYTCISYICQSKPSCRCCMFSNLQIISFLELEVEEMMQRSGYTIAVHPTYYLLTKPNQALISSSEQETTIEPLHHVLVLAKTVRNGLFSVCDTIAGIYVVLIVYIYDV